ncbi:toll-like receptor 4 [Liolophura sinensis]|uniref:toll-like receptor 4 n=1 Tax=Liolophura sinensis TaxID=3198878 RepID=UPI00315987B6
MVNLTALTVVLLLGLFTAVSWSVHVPRKSNSLIHKDNACKLRSRTFVDCREKSLKTVPNETFPETTEKLDLSLNNLHKIYSYTFRTLVYLKWLDLSFNKINKLQSHAFANLHRLEYLNINSNEVILSDNTYSPQLFVPLTSLKVLHMEKNKCIKQTGESVFPRAVAALTNLRELYTDLTTYVSFTSEFTNLTKLTTISSSGWGLPNRKHAKQCCVKRMYNATFSPFRNIGIKHFRLAYSCLQEIQLDVFEPFHELESLELVGNQQLGLYWALQSLHGLQNQTIPVLSLKAANNFIRRRKRDFSLNIFSMRYLNTICVTALDMSENYIIMPRTAPFSRPDCLRHFDMSVHVTNPQRLIRKLMHDKTFPYLQFLNISTNTAVAHDTLSAQNFDTNSSFSFSVQSSKRLNLHTVDLSFLPMSCQFESHDFYALKVLNISGWNCTIATPPLFLNLVNVTHLSARRTKFNIGLMRHFEKGSLFRNMISLEEVDLSENELTSVPQDLFLTNHKLSSLILFNNKLTGLPMEVLKTINLVHLDLSSNVIEYLTQSEIEELEKQKQQRPGFNLKLISNPFVCDCENLVFLRWLNNTNLVVDFGPEFLCTTTNGQQEQITKFMKKYKNFSVSCVSRSWLKVGVGAIFAVVVSIFVILAYYRNRWNVHYWFYTNCRPSPDMLPTRQYDYDAFVCYNHNDYDWVYETLQPYLEEGAPELRLCLHHRDFEVGEVIQQNIVDAINSSRKVILVISNNFIKSTWGEYEIEMAGMRSVQEGRANVIICVLLEEVPVRDMPRTLMNLWHRVTFLVWPQNAHEQSLFRERLTSALE